MRESPAKTYVRAQLYERILPSWRSPGALASGHALILLGPSPAEIPLLDALGFPRSAVTSVERHPDTYTLQRQWRLGISLHRREMVDFLNSALHDGTRFTLLNLDIEGSFRSQLDPAMSSVLLFCCLNQETVVVMSSTIGRDPQTLREGLATYALLRAVCPEQLAAAHDQLVRGYDVAGFTAPERMALRDAFWVRSVFEHTLRAGASLHPRASRSCAALLGACRRIWTIVRSHAGTGAIGCSDIDAAFDRLSTEERTELSDIASALVPPGPRLRRVRRITYKAAPPCAQQLWAMDVVRSEEATSVRSWLGAALTTLTAEPLLHVDRLGRPHVISADATPATPQGATREHAGASFAPRTLPLQIPDLDLRAMRQTMRALHGWRPATPAPPPPPTPTIVPQGGPTPMAKEHYVRSGQLTDAGRERVRELARADDTLTVQQVLAELPGAPPKSVAALIAIQHRAPKATRAAVKPAPQPAPQPAPPAAPEQPLVSGGSLSDSGVALVKKLAAGTPLTTAEICALIPGAPERVVRAHVAVARRAA